jgi:2-methylcitrate dehydratase
MQCSEEPTFTADYHDPEKRSIADSLTVSFRDGSTMTETVEYPLGHRRRRSEGIPLLEEKFRTNLARRFVSQRQQAILKVSLDQPALERMPVQEYVDLYAL